ncbi:MAG: hypothetical protein LQ352_001978 [Teloschistes flavicans]|nr:MAG: hypothetical protein LQ352_001978 [Teloschistes flavicans]
MVVLVVLVFFLLCYRDALCTPIAPSDISLGIDVNGSIPVDLSQPTTPHPIPLPYSYKVPRTDTILRLGLGSPVPVRKILSLLMVCEHSIAGSIATQTRDGEIDWQTPQRQNFEYDLGDGIRIHVLNLSGHVVKWGQLQIVIRGLIQFLVDGNRGYEAMFRFRSDGQGEVGWGYIAKGGNRPNMLQDH